jgi:hypothetical protein
MNIFKKAKEIIALEQIKDSIKNMQIDIDRLVYKEYEYLVVGGQKLCQWKHKNYTYYDTDIYISSKTIDMNFFNVPRRDEHGFGVGLTNFYQSGMFPLMECFLVEKLSIQSSYCNDSINDLFFNGYCEIYNYVKVHDVVKKEFPFATLPLYLLKEKTDMFYSFKMLIKGSTPFHFVLKWDAPIAVTRDVLLKFNITGIKFEQYAENYM